MPRGASSGICICSALDAGPASDVRRDLASDSRIGAEVATVRSDTAGAETPVVSLDSGVLVDDASSDGALSAPPDSPSSAVEAAPTPDALSGGAVDLAGQDSPGSIDAPSGVDSNDRDRPLPPSDGSTADGTTIRPEVAIDTGTIDAADAPTQLPDAPHDGSPDQLIVVPLDARRDAALDTATDTNTPTAPILLSLCAESVRGGASLVIRGSNFSTAPAKNSVSFAGSEAIPTSAQGDTLVVQAPASVIAGALTVTVAGLTSNPLTYDVAPRKGNVNGAGEALAGIPRGVTSNADGRILALTMEMSMGTQVVVLDRNAGTVARLTAIGGLLPNGDMSNPKLSADGRWLAFDSTASNLVENDVNDMSDVFLYEVATGTITRISNGLGGAESSGASSMPFLSANGRFVVFESKASNLTFDDNNLASDVFLYDRELGTTRCLSITGISSGLGTTANGDSTRPVISADGFVIAYQSLASNLVANDTNGVSDIFVFDRRTSKNTRVSLAPGSIQSDGPSNTPSLSADGRLVVFTSLASNFVPGVGDTNGNDDVFVYDRLATPPTIARISLTATGGQANSGASSSTRNSVSADARYVLFASDARDMATGTTAGDNNGVTDVFVRDLVAGTTRRVSVDRAGNEANGPSPTSLAAAEGQIALSTDGRLVLFLTAATNVLADDTNGSVDVALTPNSLEACPPPHLLAMAQDAIRAQAAVDICAHSLDPDPARDAITFASSKGAVSSISEYHLAATAPANVTPGSLAVQVSGSAASNGLPYVLTPLRANLGLSNAWANADATSPGASADGQRIVFTSAATNLQGGYTASATSVFMFDRWAGSLVRVNHSTGGAYPTVGYSSSSGRISADGRFVAYDSLAPNLVASDGNGQSDVFVTDLQTGTTVRVNVPASGGPEATNGGSYGPAISRDGRFIAFYSGATNLVENDNKTVLDVFVRDRVRLTTVLVSQATNGTPGNDFSRDPAISANGNFVTFRSAASSLVAGDSNQFVDIFLRDMERATTVLVSVSSAGVQSDGDSRSPAISANGRYVVFESDGTNLVDGDGNGATDIFLRDTVANTTTRISVASNGGNANGASTSPTISADGRFIAFQSDASNIVAGDTGGFTDIFVHDRQTGTTSRVSTTVDSHTEGSQDSRTPFITPEGRFVVFASRAPNLVTGDTGSVFDVFLTSRNP